jgi:hypothetical protein
MPTLETLLALLGGLALRLALPLAITALFIWLLRRLDARWLSDVEGQPLPPQDRCWQSQQCTAERRAQCAAYVNRGIPCWQQFRAANGDVNARCLGCAYFRAARSPLAHAE